MASLHERMQQEERKYVFSLIPHRPLSGVTIRLDFTDLYVLGKHFNNFSNTIGKKTTH